MSPTRSSSSSSATPVEQLQKPAFAANKGHASPAVGPPAVEYAAGPPLVDGERPFRLSPYRPVVRTLGAGANRIGAKKRRVAAESRDKGNRSREGEQARPAHDRLPSWMRQSRLRSVLCQDSRAAPRSGRTVSALLASVVSFWKYSLAFAFSPRRSAAFAALGEGV